MGTGKIYHGYRESYWQRFGHKEDYGPFVYNTTLASDDGVNDDPNPRQEKRNRVKRRSVQHRPALGGTSVLSP